MLIIVKRLKHKSQFKIIQNLTRKTDCDKG